MTREEIIEAIQHDNMMPFLQDWEVRDVVDFVLKNIQPSLPEGLEEAADMAIRGLCPIVKNGEYFFIRPQLFDVFEAGAKWDRAKMMEKAMDGKGRIDSVLPVRKFYIRAYEQGEKDTIERAIAWLKEHANEYIVDLTPTYPDAPVNIIVGSMCWEHLKKAMEEV